MPFLPILLLLWVYRCCSLLTNPLSCPFCTLSASYLATVHFIQLHIFDRFPVSLLPTLFGFTMTSSLAYDSALYSLRFLINIFFREIRPRGTWNIPRDGPVIFVVAPHHNQVGNAQSARMPDLTSFLLVLRPYPSCFRSTAQHGAESVVSNSSS